MNNVIAHPLRLTAVIYDEGVVADAMLSRFASELRRDGVDARGVVQLPPAGGRCGPDGLMALRDVETGEELRICQPLGPGAKSCRLDTGALAEAAARLRRAVESRPDVLFVAKFGKQEVAGRGFRDEIALAVCEGRTVVTAVKRTLLNEWLGFTGGVGTLLAAENWVLHDWWGEARRAA